MANYYGQTRSNYFAVKDAEAFNEELSKYPVNIITQEKDGVTLYGFLDNDIDGAGTIEYYYDKETEETTEDLDWVDFFSRHLADGAVAVIVHSGHEKYRYINGYTTAYNNKGEEIHLGLEDIYTLANQLGENITRAEH
jgi:hypothetical protein